ncbi:MAG: hypothetical protein R3A10_23515 [Caldilineaceae bacterium]
MPALIAGIKAAKGRPIVNSVTGEEERLEVVLPVVAEHNVPVIAITNDESGISYDPAVGFAAKKIVQAPRHADRPGGRAGGPVGHARGRAPRGAISTSCAWCARNWAATRSAAPATSASACPTGICSTALVAGG